MSEASECREVNATPLKVATSRTLSAQTPMLTSTIGCSTGKTIRTNCRDPKATPTRPVLKKGISLEWTQETNEDLKNLMKKITEAPCLTHFDPKNDNHVTTDACTGKG